MTTSNIIIALLVVSQIATWVLAHRTYKAMMMYLDDVAERIDFTLEALEDLRDFLRAHSYETDERIAEMAEEREETVDLDDPDWWKKS